MSISLANSLFIERPSSFFKPHLHLCLHSPQTQLYKPIICARRNKRKQIFGSAKSTKLMLESAYFIASKLKILPEPLDFMIREYAGGNGSGGGGGGGWSGFWRGGDFNGWGKKKKRMWKFWGVFVILGILGVWLVLGKELEFDAVWGALGLSLVGVSVNGWWMSGSRDWALGFCCCAVLLGWALKREDLQKWVKSFRPLKISGRRRGRRWAFHR